MSHEVLKREEKVQGSSNRSFGLVFAVVFAIIAFLPLSHGGTLRHWSLLVGLAFAVAAILAPVILTPLNRLWTRLGLVLHVIVNPIVLGIMFFLVVTPTGLLMRLFGKDPLRLKREPAATTYWISREPPGPKPETLRDQF